MPRILGAFFGVTEYRSGSGFQPLSFCGKDARLVQETLVAKSRLESVACETGRVTSGDLLSALELAREQMLAPAFQ